MTQTLRSDSKSKDSFNPSLLVLNMNNVNAQLHRARGLLTMWDFLEHKVRVGRTHIIVNRKKLTCPASSPNPPLAIQFLLIFGILELEYNPRLRCCQ